MYTFQTTFEITADLFEDVIDTALEFGIGYWARTGNHDRLAETVRITYTGEDFDADSTFASGEILLTYAEITEAIERLYNGKTQVGDWLLQQLREWLAGEPSMDADLADVIIQLACFDEIIYG